MEKLKALFDAVIAYCVNEPFHAVVVIGLIAFLLAVATLLIILYTSKQPPQSQTGKKGETKQVKPAKTAHLDNADNFSATVKTNDGKKRRKYEADDEEDEPLPPPEIITIVRPIK